jgi:hypothetical protein
MHRVDLLAWEAYNETAPPGQTHGLFIPQCGASVDKCSQARPPRLLGFVDAHLIASALIYGNLRFSTLDKRFAAVARTVGAGL